jgi:hypothetical protein
MWISSGTGGYGKNTCPNPPATEPAPVPWEAGIWFAKGNFIFAVNY